MQATAKLVVTGAAGLVGQNLVLILRETDYTNVVAIDKQSSNLRLLGELNLGVKTVEADLAEPGSWEQEFEGADTALVLHAQITGKTSVPFRRNNVDASARVFMSVRSIVVCRALYTNFEEGGCLTYTYWQRGAAQWSRPSCRCSGVQYQSAPSP